MRTIRPRREPGAFLVVAANVLVFALMLVLTDFQVLGVLGCRRFVVSARFRPFFTLGGFGARLLV